eukprot:gene11993-13091_t
MEIRVFQFISLLVTLYQFPTLSTPSSQRQEYDRRVLVEETSFRGVNSQLIVKTESPTIFYMIYREDGSTHTYQFPDDMTFKETLRMSNISDSMISTVPSNLVPGIFPSITLLPSVTTSSHNHNAILAFILQRNTFFQEAKLAFIPNHWNPAVILENSNSEESSYLIAWRQKGSIEFGRIVNVNGSISSDLFQSMRPLSGSSSLIPPDGNRHEDPRLLLLSDNRVLIAFTAVLPPVRGKRRIPHACQGFTFGQYQKNNLNERQLVMERAILFDQDFGGWQKNWVPFEYEQQLYFIHSISPTRIFRFIEKYPNNQTARYEEIKVDYRGRQRLPWKEEYGLLRGGTPAIRLQGKNSHLYLMMFHSVYSFRDYYMGAITFCAKPPFRIHSMSPVPIVNLNFYSGKRMSRKVPYVVFPTSLVLSNEGQEVMLSFGHQDKQGYLAKFSLQSLLNSLVNVESC